MIGLYLWLCRFIKSNKRAIQKGKLVEELDNRLIIIDEIHNIRSDSETEKDKVILTNIQKMVKIQITQIVITISNTNVSFLF